MPAGPGPWRLELEAPAAEAPADPPPVALAAPDDAWQRSPLDGGDSAAGIDPIDLPDVEVRVRRARLRVVSAAAAAGPGIPIARLLPAEEPGDPGLRLADGGFLPPLLTLRAAPGLRRRLDELARLLESALETARAGRGGTGPADLADPTGARRFLRAWELSGARAAIRWLADTPEAAPFEAWRTLRRLADRLDFLEGRIAGDPPAWRHETPGPALEEVLDRLRAHLWGTESVFVELLPFRRSDLGWSASPLPGHAASAALYLCVSGGGPEESVVEFVEDPDRFKLLPSGALGPSGAAGLRLRHARVVPDALAAAGRRAVHFRIVDLERKRDYWNRLLRGEPPGIQIRNDGGLAVDRGFEMRLAIVPADEGGRA